MAAGWVDVESFTRLVIYLAISSNTRLAEPPMSGLSQLPALLLQRRRAWLVALLFVLLAGGVIGGVKEATKPTSATGSLPRGADSTRVVELLETFPQQEGSSAVVLFTADAGTLAPDALTQLRAVPALAKGAPLTVSQDGTAALAVVAIPATGNAQISAAVKDLRAQVRAAAPAGVTAQVTGPAAVQADLGAVFEGADTRLLLATASVVALLLLVTYRSPLLWLVPLLVVGIADRLAAVLATQVLKATGQIWDESTVGILSVLVFGAGTDYALLLISRYRDELRREPDRYAAMRAALRHTGEAVLLSATTVVLGVLTLLLSLLPGTRALGLASAVGIVVAAGYALLVLPAVLVLFGRWIFWPIVPRVGQVASADSRSFWRRVGDLVAARPTAFVAGTLVLLAVLASGLTQVRTGLGPTDQSSRSPRPSRPPNGSPGPSRPAAPTRSSCSRPATLRPWCPRSPRFRRSPEPAPGPRPGDSPRCPSCCGPSREAMPPARRCATCVRHWAAYRVPSSAGPRPRGSMPPTRPDATAR